MRISSKVGQAFHQYSLIDYLASRFTYLSRPQWLTRICDGRLYCNDLPSSEQTVVGRGDIVSYEMPPFVEHHADLNYHIVYEDEWILGVDKPGNLLVHHHGTSVTSNLIYQLRFMNQPNFPMAHCINRIDRETSGIVLIAKDRSFLGPFHALFSDRGIEKTYHAIVHGTVYPANGTFDTPIGKDTASAIKYKYTNNGSDSREACTIYRLLRNISNVFSFIELKPITGRTHQVRVHLSCAGYPIVGDKLYGLSEYEYLRWLQNPDVLPEKMVSTRHLLHCSSVAFIHPMSGQPCVINAAMPSAMTCFLQQYEASQCENL
ncbi:MAG: RluA family pseudouridine synthase [Chitinivibrionales bacterium]|nr:RluA family pseudouridine synthase [Chitinivibrionales bacterium]